MWSDWRAQLVREYARSFGCDEAEAEAYINCTDEIWFESFADGMSPQDAVGEEEIAAAEGM